MLAALLSFYIGGIFGWIIVRWVWGSGTNYIEVIRAIVWPAMVCFTLGVSLRDGWDGLQRWTDEKREWEPIVGAILVLGFLAWETIWLTIRLFIGG
jgi:hypothetical protein